MAVIFKFYPIWPLIRRWDCRTHNCRLPPAKFQLISHNLFSAHTHTQNKNNHTQHLHSIGWQWSQSLQTRQQQTNPKKATVQITATRVYLLRQPLSCCRLPGRVGAPGSAGTTPWAATGSLTAAACRTWKTPCQCRRWLGRKWQKVQFIETCHQLCRATERVHLKTKSLI